MPKRQAMAKNTSRAIRPLRFRPLFSPRLIFVHGGHTVRLNNYLLGSPSHAALHGRNSQNNDEIKTTFCNVTFSYKSADADSLGDQISSWRSRRWYRNSMQPLWIKVQTPRGPTPRNQPGTPSVWYMTWRPRRTDDVCRGIAPRLGRCVLGDDVDMCRFCGFGSLM
jgi:hypothetical protein